MLLIIKNLDSSKAHGWDNISIKMIKICGESITVPLKIIFEQSLKERKFPELWKKANIIPAHKKEDKNLIKNYRPVSLLPIFSKIYESVSNEEGRGGGERRCCRIPQNEQICLPDNADFYKNLPKAVSLIYAGAVYLHKIYAGGRGLTLP